MLRWAIAFAGLVSIAFAQAALAPPPARAAAACSLEFAVDSAGDWFNVIGYGYKSPPINLTFSAPVFVWSIDAPGTVVGAAVTTYVVPADSVDVPDGGVFKWTFKTEDPAAKTLDVTVADAHCESSRTADLDPYGHGTPQPTFPTPSLPSGDCTGHYVLYDRNAPGVPAVDTRWFNLFDSGFDNHALVTLTFDVPVIPWRMVHDPDVLPAVTTYTMPPNSKWAFRARDVGVTSITIKMTSRTVPSPMPGARYAPPP